MEKKIKQITNILKTIKYPGFSRDIVSFGIIKSINIKNDILFIEININTDNRETIETLKNEIYLKITKEFKFKTIEINLVNANVDSNNNKIIKNIIAVSSCKGGVGKSTIALNLAYELSKNNSVGLLDLDIYGPSLPTLINSKINPKIDENKIIPIVKDNIKFMSFGFLNNENSPTIWRGPMVSRMTQQFFDNVEWGSLDYLILDLPPGTGDIQLTLVQKIALTGAIIITTPQYLSHIDVAKGVDMFKKVKTPILGIIENMSNYILNGSLRLDYSKEFKPKLIVDNKIIEIDDDGNFFTILDIFKGNSGKRESQRSNIPLLGKISLDSKISECCDSGIPYVIKFPNTQISKQFGSIAEKIINGVENN